MGDWWGIPEDWVAIQGDWLVINTVGDRVRSEGTVALHVDIEWRAGKEENIGTNRNARSVDPRHS